MIVKAHELTKKYRLIYALRNVSLEIGKGLTLIIGPNGSGKSTLLKIISGFIKPTGGSIKVFNKDPWREREKIITKIGVSFDPPRIPWWYTGKEYLEILAKTRGGSLWKVLGIEKFWDRMIYTYSAGMLRRLSIASALAGEPDLVLLDEPFSGIDLKSYDEITNLLKELKEVGFNMIISSHIFRPLKTLYDNIYALDSGELVDVEEYLRKMPTL